jgi:hypothetical protein
MNKEEMEDRSASPSLAVPTRIQRKRSKGWKMPANTIYVGRPTVFGNVSTCGHPHNCALVWCECCPHEGDDWCCVKSYREYVVSGIENRPSRSGLLRYASDALDGYPQRTKLVAALPTLRGKNLACWCSLDKPCHADVLLELANAAQSSANAVSGIPLIQSSKEGE